MKRRESGDDVKKFMGFVKAGFVKGESEKDREKKIDALTSNLMSNLIKNSDGYFGDAPEETKDEQSYDPMTLMMKNKRGKKSE